MIKRPSALPGGAVNYFHDDFDKPSFVKSRMLVTSVRVVLTPGHDQVTIFNRGGNAGTITVDKGDGEKLASRLLDVDKYRLAHTETGRMQTGPNKLKP